jgi:LCP family protein required for cell wall assembly
MSKPKNTFLLAMIAFLLASSIVGIGAWAVSNYAQNIPLIKSINPKNQQDQVKQKPDKETILLLGAGGKNHDGGGLTDTIMIAQILNKEKQIHLISLPRDMLVFDKKGIYSKLNAVYIDAIAEGKTAEESIKVLQNKITEITGITFDHYAEVDFEGFVSLVDKLGGIEVDVKEAIDDPYYPGPNYSYQRFTIQPGVQTLNGETALKYARSRYTSKGGDLDRSRRQQQILSNVKDRIFNLNPILDAPKIVSLLGIAKDSLKTDLSLTDMKNFYDTYKDSKDYTINSVVIGQNLLTGNMKEGYRQFGANRGYIIEPRIGEQNYLEIKEEIININDITAYQEKITKLIKVKSQLNIVWGDTITPIQKKHIQEFLEARGFSIKSLSSGNTPLSRNPNTNTLYTGNNPYNTETDKTTDPNISNEYLQSVFKADINTTVSLDNNIPILYISSDIVF